MGFDQIDEDLLRQLVPLKGLDQCRGDRAAVRLRARLAGDYVMPPLQAHFARERLTHPAGHLADFDFESIERKQCGALLRRSEERREKTVAILVTDQPLAIFE